MTWWLFLLIAVYVSGFTFVLWFNLNLGMISIPLALLRAVVWPLYVTTGRPHGRQMPMD
jgi:uncharacterized membrane protein YozB (DUF420 family)